MSNVNTMYAEIFEQVTKPNTTRRLLQWSDVGEYSFDEIASMNMEADAIMGPIVYPTLTKTDLHTGTRGLTCDPRYLLVGTRSNKVEHREEIGRLWTAGMAETTIQFRDAGDHGTTEVNIAPAFSGILAAKKDRKFMEALAAVGRDLMAQSAVNIEGTAKRAAFLVEKGRLNIVRFKHRLAAMYVVTSMMEELGMDCNVDAVNVEAQAQRMLSVTNLENSLSSAIKGQNFVYHERMSASPGNENALQVLYMACNELVYSPEVRRIVGPTVLSYWPELGDVTFLYRAQVTEENLTLAKLTSADVHAAALEFLGAHECMDGFFDIVKEIMILSFGTPTCRKIMGQNAIMLALPTMDSSVLGAGPILQGVRDMEERVVYYPRESLRDVLYPACLKRMQLEVCTRTAVMSTGGTVELSSENMHPKMRELQILSARPHNTVTGITKLACSVMRTSFGQSTLGRTLSTIQLAYAPKLADVEDSLRAVVAHKGAVQWEELARWAQSLPEGSMIGGLTRPVSFKPTDAMTGTWYRPILHDNTISDHRALHSLVTAAHDTRTFLEVAYCTLNTTSSFWTHSSTPYYMFTNYRGVPGDMQGLPFANKEQEINMPVVRFSSTDQVMQYSMHARRRSECQWYMDIMDEQAMTLANVLAELDKQAANNTMGSGLPRRNGAVATSNPSDASSMGIDDEASLMTRTIATVDVEATTHEAALLASINTRQEVASALKLIGETYFQDVEAPKWIQNYETGVQPSGTGPQEASRASSLSNVYDISRAWDPINTLKSIDIRQRAGFMQDIAAVMRSAAVHAAPIQQASIDFRSAAERYTRMSIALKQNPGLTVEEVNDWWRKSYLTVRQGLIEEAKEIKEKLDNSKRDWHRNPAKRTARKSELQIVHSKLNALKTLRLSSNAGDTDVEKTIRVGANTAQLCKLSDKDAEKRRKLEEAARKQEEELLARLDMDVIASMKAAGEPLETLHAMGYMVPQHVWDALGNEPEEEATRLQQLGLEDAKSREEAAEQLAQQPALRETLDFDAGDDDIMQAAIAAKVVMTEAQLQFLTPREQADYADAMCDRPIGSSWAARPPDTSPPRQGTPPPLDKADFMEESEPQTEREPDFQSPPEMSSGGPADADAPDAEEPPTSHDAPMTLQFQQE